MEKLFYFAWWVVIGLMFSSRKSKTKSRVAIEMALSKSKKNVISNPVVVFSETYCGFCLTVMNLLSLLGATYKLIDLNKECDGEAIKIALSQWTGQDKVPSVFIGGKHIGGYNDVFVKHEKGELVPLLTEAGAISFPRKRLNFNLVSSPPFFS